MLLEKNMYICNVNVKQIVFIDMENNNIKPLIFETRDTMPEVYTTNELYQMAVKDFNERCDEIEQKYGYK